MKETLLKLISSLTTENIIDIVIPIVVVVISAMLVKARHKRKYKMISARKRLYQESAEYKKWQCTEGVFFQEPSRTHNKFYRKFPVSELSAGSNTSIKLAQMSKSYLIMGDAGCGKSSLLENKFQQTIFWVSIFRLIYGVGICYLDAERVINFLTNDNEMEDFLARIKQAKLKKLYLFVDGVDEISDVHISNFHNLVSAIKARVDKTILRFSCRTEFANKHLRNLDGHRKYRFDHIYAVNAWKTDQLIALAKNILNDLKEVSATKKKAVEKFISNPADFIRNITSPLLMKLLIYIKLFSQSDISLTGNNFQVYSSFFEAILTVYIARNTRVSFDINKQIDEIAASVFDAYAQGKKTIIYTDSLKSLRPIVKVRPNYGSKAICLSHETFFEYLIARHYHNQFKDGTLLCDSVEVLCTPYSNDYADFITAAFAGDSDEQQVNAMHAMGRLYSYTLNQNMFRRFNDEFQLGNTDRSSVHKRLQEQRNLTSTEKNPFLTLKSEIAFRFGRFLPSLETDFRIQFLKFVYENDSDTEAKSEKEYFVAVLKRCCAVSSSFLGGEEIELDYVKHMLNFCPDYDANFDLANRSHTLIFYGDVSDSNIFTFRDTGQHSWSNARSKRIERLRTELPNSLSAMSNKEKKKYYFRLFDSATIYSFLASRPKYELAEDEKNVLRSFNVDFAGMSQARRDLLKAIKNNTQQFVS